MPRWRIAETFDVKVGRLSMPEPNSGCWIWIGTLNHDGYGQVQLGNKCKLAHRYVYEELRGAVPEGLSLDHLCRTRCCVNPAHLEPVTHQENVLRGNAPAAINKRKTHCKRGHPLSGNNLYPTRDGKRQCRACLRARGYAVTLRRRAEKARQS